MPSSTRKINAEPQFGAEYPTPEEIAEKQLALCSEMEALYPDRKWALPSALDFDDAFCYSDEVLGEAEHPLPDHRGVEVLRKRIQDLNSEAGFQTVLI